MRDEIALSIQGDPCQAFLRAALGTAIVWLGQHDGVVSINARPHGKISHLDAFLSPCRNCTESIDGNAVCILASGKTDHMVNQP